MILSYASILEKQAIVLAEAERLLADADTPEHRALVKELRDPFEHLERLVGRGVAKSVERGAHRCPRCGTDYADDPTHNFSSDGACTVAKKPRSGTL